MKYEIISTGSSGNCVIINDVMIDCGVPFNRIKEHLYHIKYLLLTHIHSDHIKPNTLATIKKLFPKIKIIGNHEIHQMYRVHTISNTVFPIKTDDYEFNAFACVHDVVTQGFTWEFEGQAIIYATDTASMQNAPDKKFDYIFIESNHDERKVEMILNHPNKYGYNAYAGAKRHLSTQQAKLFFYTHRRDKESHFIELHQSTRFY